MSVACSTSATRVCGRRQRCQIDQARKATETTYQVGRPGIQKFSTQRARLGQRNPQPVAKLMEKTVSRSNLDACRLVLAYRCLVTRELGGMTCACRQLPGDVCSLLYVGVLFTTVVRSLIPDGRCIHPQTKARAHAHTYTVNIHARLAVCGRSRCYGLTSI